MTTHEDSNPFAEEVNPFSVTTNFTLSPFIRSANFVAVFLIFEQISG